MVGGGQSLVSLEGSDVLSDIYLPFCSFLIASPVCYTGVYTIVCQISLHIYIYHIHIHIHALISI